MRGKLQPNEFEKIIAPLPTKERIALREHPPGPEWLRDQVEVCRKLMKRDLWVGPIWFAVYGLALFTTQFSIPTIGIFVAGAGYFIYTIFTTGSFGLNKKRVQVYRQLLEKLEG